MLKTDDNGLDFRRGLELIGHFRGQFRALSDESVLETLKSAGSVPFTNAKLRKIMGMKRGAAWVRLSKLVEVGLIEKRGHTYMISTSTASFVGALSSALTALVTGREVRTGRPVWLRILKLAGEGIEMLYAKGRIQPKEFWEYKAMLKEMEANGSE